MWLVVGNEPGLSVTAEQGGASTPAGPGSGAAAPDTHADITHVTTEELAAALLGDGADLGGGADTEDREDDGIEWEDADVVTEADAGQDIGVAEAAGPAQPQRRDVWSRTHGYKFGRKLGDWSGGGEDVDVDLAPAADVSPAVDPVEAAVLGAAASVLGEDRAAEGTAQEQRSLQHGILNSLGVREPDIDAAVHVEAAGTDLDVAVPAPVVTTDASGGEINARAHVDQGYIAHQGRGSSAADCEDGEDREMCEHVMPLAESATPVREQGAQQKGGGRGLPRVEQSGGDGGGSSERRGIAGEASPSGTGVSARGETSSVAAQRPGRGGLKMPRWGGSRVAAGGTADRAPQCRPGQHVATRVSMDAAKSPPDGAAAVRFPGPLCCLQLPPFGCLHSGSY